MRVMDDFILEGGIAMENYGEISSNLRVGDVLEGTPCPEGIEFSKDGTVYGYMLADLSLFAQFLHEEGHAIRARITEVDTTYDFPTFHASLHILRQYTVMGKFPDYLDEDE